jgi:hypothetical protein
MKLLQNVNLHEDMCGQEWNVGRAVAQAVSRWLPTAAARVRIRAGNWGLWWTKRHWGRFSPSTSVSPANHSTNFSIIITRGWDNRPIGGRKAEWTQLDHACGTAQTRRSHQLHGTAAPELEARSEAASPPILFPGVAAFHHSNLARWSQSFVTSRALLLSLGWSSSHYLEALRLRGRKQ